MDTVREIAMSKITNQSDFIYDPKVDVSYRLSGKELIRRIETIKILHYEDGISRQKLAKYLGHSIATIDRYLYRSKNA